LKWSISRLKICVLTLLCVGLCSSDMRSSKRIGAPGRAVCNPHVEVVASDSISGSGEPRPSKSDPGSVLDFFTGTAIVFFRKSFAK
jgi:hypothetical protein